MRIVLVTGGTKSGKSRYSVSRARELGGDSVTFLATARAVDEEMRRRIDRHRGERPATWQTIEAPVRVGEPIIGAAGDVVLLDCVTMLLANALAHAEAQTESTALSAMATEVDELLAAASARSGTLLLVTNEVGSAIHPITSLGRWFEHGLGVANQRLAAEASEVVLLVCGLPVLVKSGGGATQ
jgi:adenosylcobinamide kinase/adenosylcobinamide-phosphate guanylyltransferase